MNSYFHEASETRNALLFLRFLELNMKNLIVAKLVALVVFLITMPAFAGSGTNMLQYLPSDADMVFALNVENLRTSPLFPQIWGMIETMPEYAEAMADMQQIGFDPRTDVNTLLFAGSSSQTNDDMVLLIEGNFNRPAIEGIISMQDETTVGQIGSLTYYSHEDQLAGFLSDSIVAFGDTSRTLPAFSVAAGAPNGAGLSNALQGQATAAASSSTTFWISGMIIPEMVVSSPELADVEAYRSTINLVNGLIANILLVTVSPAVATAFATDINTQLTQVRGMQEVAAFGLTNVVNGIIVIPVGNEVSATINVDQATIDTLAATFGPMIQQQMQ